MWLLLLTLLSDGKNHIVAVAVTDPQSRLFYGDTKQLFAVPVDPADNTGPMPDGSWKRTFLDPRFPGKTQIKDYRDLQKSITQVSFDGKSYKLQCGERSAPLTLLPEGKPAPVVAADPVKPYALARDDRGHYFYVDRAGEKRFRVFSGAKGSLKRLKMTNVVSDSEGDLFATTTGDLRLLIDKKEVAWIEAGARRKLTLVPVEENIAMIYNELGVYAGEKLHTPCDDL